MKLYFLYMVNKSSQEAGKSPGPSIVLYLSARELIHGNIFSVSLLLRLYGAQVQGLVLVCICLLVS